MEYEGNSCANICCHYLSLAHFIVAIDSFVVKISILSLSWTELFKDYYTLIEKHHHHHHHKTVVVLVGAQQISCSTTQFSIVTITHPVFPPVTMPTLLAKAKLSLCTQDQSYSKCGKLLSLRKSYHIGNAN